MPEDTYTDILNVDLSRYRFGGYSLPMVQLDETGPSYIALLPHPEYRRSGPYWQAASALTYGTDFENMSLADENVFPVLPFGED